MRLFPRRFELVATASVILIRASVRMPVIKGIFCRIRIERAAPEGGKGDSSPSGARMPNLEARVCKSTSRWRILPPPNFFAYGEKVRAIEQ